MLVQLCQDFHLPMKVLADQANYDVGVTPDYIINRTKAEAVIPVNPHDTHNTPNRV